MQYLLLIYSSPEAWAAKSEAEMADVMAEHRKLDEELRTTGQYVGANALEWGDAATTLRVRDGRSLVTDGPYAETREQLGGYYLVDCKDLDDAMAIAAHIPNAGVGGVEIRPVKNL